jgi:hypothetical protein
MKGSASLEAVWLAAGDGLVIERCQVFSRGRYAASPSRS